MSDYAELAQATGFDRSRITRIMNLRLLEPGEQEAILREENFAWTRAKTFDRFPGCF